MKFAVTFQLEVEGEECGNAIEEAISAVFDEELFAHQEGGTRCGIRFLDVTSVQAEQHHNPITPYLDIISKQIEYVQGQMKDSTNSKEFLTGQEEAMHWIKALLEERSR